MESKYNLKINVNFRQDLKELYVFTPAHETVCYGLHRLGQVLCISLVAWGTHQQHIPPLCIGLNGFEVLMCSLDPCYIKSTCQLFL